MMNNLYRFFALMALTLAWMMPAKAQHPFTLTTESDITTSTQHYYLIQSFDRPTFYAIPHSNAEDSKVSTTSIPNASMRWYFMDAGSDSDHQYYYIVSSTGRCLYRMNDDNDGIRIKNTYADLSSLSDDELNKYKFYLTPTGSNYFIQPKGASNLYLNKKGTNPNYTNYIKASTYFDSPSIWNFVAVGDATWPQPFTISTNTDTHYYKFQNVTNTSFCLSTSEEWATVSSTGNNEKVWYFLDAGTDATYSNCHYYYIVNSSTEKYLYYTGGTSDDVAKVMNYNSGEDDKYRFLIVDAAYKPDNINYATGYTIVPKLKQTSFSGKDSFAPMDMSDNSHLLLKSDRGTANYDSHWEIEETVYVLVEAPEITYDNVRQEINITCGTEGATIYYTLDGNIPTSGSTQYNGPVSCTSPCTIKAIAVKSDLSEVTTYGLQKVAAPTFSPLTYTNEVTITSTAGASIYYSIGTENTPSVGVNPYTAPFEFPYTQSNQPIKAIAVKEGWINSDTGQETFMLNCYMPTLSFDNGTQKVTLSCNDAGATMYYTTNGNTPDPGQSGTTQYLDTPFDVSLGSTVKAIATHSGYHNSQVAILPIAQTHDYSQDYLTFRILTTGTIAWKGVGGGHNMTIEYSIDNGAWTSITATTTPVTFYVTADQTVRFRGSNPAYAKDKSNYSAFYEGTATYNAEGNIMSLIYGDNFSGQTTLTAAWALSNVFNHSKVVSAQNLIMPATTLTSDCYRATFANSPLLTIAPELPAMTLATDCYYYMFDNCESLTTAPELLAPTLVTNCYYGMFHSDHGNHISYIKCLATNPNTTNTQYWVQNVEATGTFVKDPNASWSTGNSGIPSGWVVNNYLAPPEDPVITCDGEFITITCDTYGADIYYSLNQTGSYSLYSAPIAIHENTVVEAYAVKNELPSNIVSENCTAIKTYKFAGMQITPGPLYYGSNGYEIKDGWNYDSYNSVYGKTVGSTYFNFIELGQLFESSVFSTSDGDIENVLDPLDGWRVPTNTEWASILGTTRSGSTVNGSSNKHYAMIQLADVSGLLIFPDGEMITGTTLSNMDNTTSNTGIIESQLNDYLDQGCIFLPGSGYYNGNWGNGQYYWSSTENNSSTGYVSSGDTNDKETYYFPVYLVKDAADEATRLLRTWTYNGNEVELPYSINAIDGHSANYAKGTFNFTTNVKVKELQPTYLWFQHADQSATVYVDNTLVKKHWGGYNAFFVDITNYVHVGTNNIKVAIKNNEGNKLAPCAGDFNFNATLGEVKLISSPVVPDTVYGYDGFHIKSTVTAASATITVKTSVPTSATLTCSIKGTNCNYSNTQTGTGEITFTTTINDPHLWNGTLDPYLYDVTLTIAKDGVVYHKFKRGYGLRFYEYVVDNQTPANSRFMLNGSPYLLRGVCMHHDLEGKANALTAADIDNDFEILKELGCNFVRLAHYPHPKEVYDWCDKLGIIVQTEVPWVNNAQTTQPTDYYNHLEDQYRDMVNQHYNHPCIMFWGLSNETTTADNTESKNFIKTKIENYRRIIKELDLERKVGYVMSHSVDNPSGYYNDPEGIDWFGCNIYVGWYIDKTSNNPTNRLDTRLDKTLARIKKPLAFSEYGCGGTPNCHSDDYMTTTTTGNNPRHDIEYQMWLHEGHIAAIKNKPQLLFTSQWQLFDIAVYNRVEGYKVCPDGETVFDNNELKRLNNKGLVERDHKTKKDPFYLYKAWWNQTDKFVHICGKDYKKLTNRVIKCYTNDGGTLKLYVNDEEIQTVAVVDNIAEFTARNFNPGDVVRVNGATTNDTFTMTNYNAFTTEGDWDEADNWSAGVVPSAGCDVDIVADATVPNGCTANAGNITLYGGTLTIADGGQLQHNNEGVVATVEKDITAYTVIQNQGESLTNGWYFIASPITDDYTPTGSMVANTYDLYHLNNTTWENFKNTTDHPDFTTLNNGTGYLYANSGNVTLQFTGALKPYDATYGITLSEGFNLVGNPYTFDAYVNRPYYKMNAARTAVVAVSDNAAIAPCTGVVVDYTDGQSAVFTNAPAQSQSNNGGLNITVAQQVVARGGSNTETLDNAIVNFKEDSQLGKFYFGTQNANIYIPQNGKEFAVVSAQAQGEMPVNFKANENGTYTITINAENVEMGYLHLIDNMTGTDVDLLQTPSYSFEAKTTDYESRFKLVFACGDANDDNETFAFINNGNIIITADVEGATLQVIDVMGRVVYQGDAINRVSTNGMTPGMYVLRLINGDKVMTQKIVIR